MEVHAPSSSTNKRIYLSLPISNKIKTYSPTDRYHLPERQRAKIKINEDILSLMAELLVILYPATCLTFTAIFLVFLNRESIIYGLVRCAQLIDLGNDYVELHVQTDNTEFESETELKDLEDQWYAPPAQNKLNPKPQKKKRNQKE